jgi:putative transposase
MHIGVIRMKRSYCQIYIHVIWTIKNRELWIVEPMERDIYELINLKAQKYESEIIAIGNTNEHIHVLIKVSPKILITEMIREFKGSSSYFINNRAGGILYWQDGYGILSVSPSAVNTVKKYVENQKIRHKLKKTIDRFEIIEEEM